ncbi:MAG: hypothetical protein VZS44_10085 [Bacilli bacterium]|nr:hypothetical protein [Bacilli bacterium]
MKTKFNEFRKKYGSGQTIFAILVVLLVIWLVLGESILKVINPQTYIVTVQSKEVKNTSDDSGKYLVFTVDAETGESRVFEVTDSLWKGRFNSADVYNMIQINHTYKFETGGYRIPLLSYYPNIYKYTDITEE